MKSHFLASEIKNAPPEEAKFHVIPAPLEASVSYGGGTRKGPAAILKASNQLEVITNGMNPSTGGIHTRKWISPSLKAPRFLSELKQETHHALKSGAIPVVLGGEHSLSFAPIEACFEYYGEKIGVFQIDAHADLRLAYEGNVYSHASVMRRVVDDLKLPLVQVGVRALCQEEIDYRKEKGITHYDGRKMSEENLFSVKLPSDFPEKVYLSIDVDGLDSSVMPATGTPVPGGLGWYQLLSVLRALAGERRIIGFDVVELAPRDCFSFCDFTTAQLVYDVMGMI